jgi:hypothetical protein
MSREHIERVGLIVYRSYTIEVFEHSDRKDGRFQLVITREFRLERTSAHWPTKEGAIAEAKRWVDKRLSWLD